MYQDNLKYLAGITAFTRYHGVIVPKYRRKSMFGAIRKDVGEMFRTLCGQF
jgi:putative transposase